MASWMNQMNACLRRNLKIGACEFMKILLGFASFCNLWLWLKDFKIDFLKFLYFYRMLMQLVLQLVAS